MGADVSSLDFGGCAQDRHSIQQNQSQIHELCDKQRSVPGGSRQSSDGARVMPADEEDEQKRSQICRLKEQISPEMWAPIFNMPCDEDVRAQIAALIMPNIVRTGVFKQYHVHRAELCIYAAGIDNFSYAQTSFQILMQQLTYMDDHQDDIFQKLEDEFAVKHPALYDYLVSRLPLHSVSIVFVYAAAMFDKVTVDQLRVVDTLALLNDVIAAPTGLAAMQAVEDSVHHIFTALQDEVLSNPDEDPLFALRLIPRWKAWKKSIGPNMEIVIENPSEEFTEVFNKISSGRITQDDIHIDLASTDYSESPRPSLASSGPPSDGGESADEQFDVQLAHVPSLKVNFRPGQLGMDFSDDGTIYNVTEGSPAHQQHVQAGMQIRRIDNEAFSADRLQEFMVGSAGNNVMLSLAQASSAFDTFGNVIARISGFSTVVVSMEKKAKFKSQAEAMQAQSGLQITIAKEAEVTKVLGALRSRGLRLTSMSIRYRVGKHYLRKSVNLQQWGQVCKATFLYGAQQLTFISVTKFVTQRYAAKAEEKADANIGDVLKDIGLIGTEVLPATMTKVREIMGEVTESNLKSRIASLPHEARHCLCRAFTEYARVAPQQVVDVLNGAMQKDTSGNRSRWLTIFASPATVRLVKADVMAELFQDLMNRSADLKVKVLQCVKELCIWHLLFQASRTKMHSVLFTHDCLEQICGKTFKNLSIDIGTSEGVATGTDASPVAVIDRGHLPDEVEEYAYMQSVGASVAPAAHRGTPAGDPKFSSGSLWVELTEFEDGATIANWLVANQLCFDGYGARVLSIIPGDVGKHMMAVWGRPLTKAVDQRAQLCLEVRSSLRLIGSASAMEASQSLNDDLIAVVKNTWKQALADAVNLEGDLLEKLRAMTHQDGAGVRPSRRLVKSMLIIVGNLVDGLSSDEELFPKLQDLGKSHAHDLRMSDYAVMGEALLQSLKETLGGDFTDGMERAWVSFCRFISSMMAVDKCPEVMTWTRRANVIRKWVQSEGPEPENLEVKIARSGGGSVVTQISCFAKNAADLEGFSSKLPWKARILEAAGVEITSVAAVSMKRKAAEATFSNSGTIPTITEDEPDECVDTPVKVRRVMRRHSSSSAGAAGEAPQFSANSEDAADVSSKN